MCYKDEVQKRNAEKLNKKLDEVNAPQFIRDYFYNLNSEAGKVNYWYTISQLLNWLNQKGKLNEISTLKSEDMKKISKTDMIMYLENLINEGSSPSTINTKKNILGSFWSYLVDEDIVCKNIIHSIPKTKFKIKKKNNAKVPLPEDITEMIEKINSKKDDFIRNRNLIIIRVLKGTGLRESELAGLDMNDLHLDCEHPYIDVMGKGVYYKEDSDTVLISKDAKAAIEEWLEIRKNIDNIIDEKALFINKNGKRMNEDNIKAMFRIYSNGKITPHMMRHLYGTILYQESGHNAALVQEQLRHSDVNTTLGIYVSGQNDESYKAIDNI